MEIEQKYVNGGYSGHVNYESTSNEDFDDETYYDASSFCKVEVENDENEFIYNTKQPVCLIILQYKYKFTSFKKNS